MYDLFNKLWHLTQNHTYKKLVQFINDLQTGYLLAYLLNKCNKIIYIHLYKNNNMNTVRGLI